MKHCCTRTSGREKTKGRKKCARARIFNDKKTERSVYNNFFLRNKVKIVCGTVSMCIFAAIMAVSIQWTRGIQQIKNKNSADFKYSYESFHDANLEYIRNIREMHCE